MHHAPGRGRYDRALSSRERIERQHFVLLTATAAALDTYGSAGVTVERITARAAVGRNTFYAHFEDALQAIAATKHHAAEVLFAPVDEAGEMGRTPIESVRAMSVAWLASVQKQPVLARVLLLHTVGVDPRSRQSDAIRRWTDILTRLMTHARRAGLLSHAVGSIEQDVCVMAVAGQYYALGLRAATERMDAELEGGLLADFALKAMR